MISVPIGRTVLESMARPASFRSSGQVVRTSRVGLLRPCRIARRVVGHARIDGSTCVTRILVRPATSQRQDRGRTYDRSDDRDAATSPMKHRSHQIRFTRLVISVVRVARRSRLISGYFKDTEPEGIWTVLTRFVGQSSRNFAALFSATTLQHRLTPLRQGGSAQLLLPTPAPEETSPAEDQNENDNDEKCFCGHAVKLPPGNQFCDGVFTLMKESKDSPVCRAISQGRC